MSLGGFAPARENTTAADVLAVLAAMLFPTLLTWVYFVELSGQSRVVQQTVYTVGKTMQFAGPLLWAFWLGRRLGRATVPAAPSDAAPGDMQPSRRTLAEGLAFGMAVFLLMVFGSRLPAMASLLEPAADAIRAKVAAFGVDTPAKFIALGAFYAVVHALLEEYYWRWFVFGSLARMVSQPAAIGVSSIAFAAHHVIVLAWYFGWAATPTWLFSLAVASGGAFWAWNYRRGQSLFSPWLSHLLIDAAIFTVAYGLVFAG